MSELTYSTIAEESPQGKPKIYFSCCPIDHDNYYNIISTLILSIQDCAIWYETEYMSEYDKDVLEFQLSQMQLFIIPVTSDLLMNNNRCMDFEYEIAIKYHIPVLPIMMENGLDSLFERRFGSVQYIDYNNDDPTKISYRHQLEEYLNKTILGEELKNRIKKEFSASIFLSYRKKDRKYAQELMKMIHRYEEYRDVSFWYDEFLQPGEDYNIQIENKIYNCNMFVMVITPHILEDHNYVIKKEYPFAKNAGKTIVPVEMVSTEEIQIREQFPGIEKCCSRYNISKSIQKQLTELFPLLNANMKEDTPEHKYLIGRAYLEGVDVEIDTTTAVKLIKDAASENYLSAIELLIHMYSVGKGVEANSELVLFYRQLEINLFTNEFSNNPNVINGKNLAYAFNNLAGFYTLVNNSEEAINYYYRFINLIEEIYEKTKNINYLKQMFDGYLNIGRNAQLLHDEKKAAEVYGYLLDNIESIKEFNFIDIERTLYYKVAELAKDKGDLHLALKYLKEREAIESSIQNEINSKSFKEGYIRTLLAIADIERLNINVNGAKEYYRQALEIVKKLLNNNNDVYDRKIQAMCHLECGRIEIGRNNELALDHLLKSLTIINNIIDDRPTFEFYNDKVGILDVLGLLNLNKKELEEARRYYYEELKLIQYLVKATNGLNYKIDVVRVKFQIAEVDKTQGNLEDAKKQYEYCAHAYNDYFHLTLSNELLRYVFLSIYKWGEVENIMGNQKEAITLLNKSKELALYYDNINKTNKSKLELIKIYRYLYETHTDEDEKKKYLKLSLDILEKLPQHVLNRYVDTIRFFLEEYKKYYGYLRFKMSPVGIPMPYKHADTTSIRNCILNVAKKELCPSPAYTIPNIPDNLVTKALIKYAISLERKEIVLLIDTSFLKNGSKGYIFTGEALYAKEVSDSTCAQYKYIKEINIINKNNGIKIVYTYGKSHVLKTGKNTLYIYRILKAVLRTLINNLDESNSAR